MHVSALQDGTCHDFHYIQAVLILRVVVAICDVYEKLHIPMDDGIDLSLAHYYCQV